MGEVMTDLELLKAARKLIEDAPYLLKGSYLNSKDHCFCTLGAFETVDGTSYTRRLDKQYHYAGLLSFEGPGAIIEWNDNDSTTKQDVLDRFDEAIKRLKG